MNKITTYLWYEKDAKQAAELYVTLFKNSKIENVSVIKDTPSGDCDMVSFNLSGVEFQSIGAGPYLKFTPAISLFAVFDTEEEIDLVWKGLSEGGEVLMEYSAYPWAKKYGWLKDKFGLSWQLSLSEHHDMAQKITPSLMFTGPVAGKAKEAIDYYTSVFPNSKVDLLAHYEKGEGDSEGFIKHSRFSLSGAHFIAMDSSAPHKFNFTGAISFIVSCKDQKEIDYYWEKLSAVKEAEQCGWVMDKFGVSWQVVPSIMGEMMTEGTPEQSARVTQAFLKMKKFDIAALEKAFKGE